MKVTIKSSLLLLCTAFAFGAIAQVNQWAFIKGDTTTGKYGVYGVQGISTHLNSPGARTNYVSWTDHAGNFWLFGGSGNAAHTTGYLNDLWRFNPTTYQWTWVKGDSVAHSLGKFGTQGLSAATNNPRARGGAMCWMDEAQNLWLFGGEVNFTTTGYSFMNDLWKYNITSNEWTWVNGDTLGGNRGRYNNQGEPSPNNIPGARKNSVTWTEGNNLWLFGGSAFTANKIGAVNDLWKYNTSTNQWTWVKGDSVAGIQGSYGAQGNASAGNKPGARVRSAGWKDKAGNFWLFGGEVNGNFLNDLWKYNPVANDWTWVKGDSTINMKGIYGAQGNSSAANAPGARSSCTAWTDTWGNVWLFGGQGYASTGKAGRTNDLWTFSPTKNEWSFISGDAVIDAIGKYGKRGIATPSNKPGARALANAGWIDLYGNLWLFAGGTATTSFNDLWKFFLH